MKSEDLLGRILYRDGMMLVIDKPAGIAVHRGPKGGENLEDYFYVLAFGLPRVPHLAHRLDRETSGCLVLGRHHKALERLGKLFKEQLVSKTYWAVVEDGPAADEGLIDMPLGRKDANRGWWMQHDPMGLPSQTRWRVLGRGLDGEGKSIAWLEYTPLSGRTHQLRVHSASSGFPIAGDNIYGSAARDSLVRLQLLAREIVVPMSKNGEPVRVSAPVPDHMKALLHACGWRAQDETARHIDMKKPAGDEPARAL